MKKGKGFASDSRLYDCPSIWVRGTSIRAHYFTTYTGSDEIAFELKVALRKIEFTPHLFKKEKQSNKQKGLDITQATELLSNAFMKNFDVVVLIAGDADYLPLIEQVKRLGRSVIVGFFDKPKSQHSPIHPDLKLAADGFCDITHAFLKGWNQEKNRTEKQAPTRSHHLPRALVGCTFKQLAFAVAIGVLAGFDEIPYLYG